MPTETISDNIKTSFFSWVFGIASLLSFVITVVAYYFLLFKGITAPEVQVFIATLSLMSLTLLVAFVAFTYNYIKKTNTFAFLRSENQRLENHAKKAEISLKSTSSCLHNILHNHRNFAFHLDEFLENYYKDSNNISLETCNSLIVSFEAYLQLVLANLKAYLDSTTNDNCATCIKLLKDEKIRTFYRDIVSYGRRKRSDYNLDGTPVVYNVNGNWGFHIIVSESYMDRTYFCDDLYNEKYYRNVNENWKHYYCATAVVPISKRILPKKDKNEILGFLCADNFKGGLAIESVKDFMCGVGDNLYNIFTKFPIFANVCIEKGVQHDKIQSFSAW